MPPRPRRGPAARSRLVQLGSGSAGGSNSPLEASTAVLASERRSCASALLTMSERAFQRAVRGTLESRGWVCWVVPNMKLTAAGLPDILAWHAKLPGLLLALELKRERDARITPSQAAALAHLETVPGIEARILRPSGWERLRDTLDLMLQHASVREVTP